MTCFTLNAKVKLLGHLTCGKGQRLGKVSSCNHINWNIKRPLSPCTHMHFSLCNASAPRKLLPSPSVLPCKQYSFLFFEKLFSWKQNEKTSLTSYLLCNQDVSTLVCKTPEGGPWDDCKTPMCNPFHTADGDKSLRAGWHRQEPIPHRSQYLIKKLTETVKWGFCKLICFCLLQYELLWYLSHSQPNTWR